MKAMTIQQALVVSGGTLTKKDLNEINDNIKVATGMVLGMFLMPTLLRAVMGVRVTSVDFAILGMTQIAGAAIGGQIALSFFTSQPTAIEPVEAN